MANIYADLGTGEIYSYLTSSGEWMRQPSIEEDAVQFTRILLFQFGHLARRPVFCILDSFPPGLSRFVCFWVSFWTTVGDPFGGRLEVMPVEKAAIFQAL